MIPVQPFVSEFFCQRHQCQMIHDVQFMEYDPATNTVTFMATCEECEEEAEDDKEIIGFTASLPAPEWDKITPLEDNVIFN